MRILLPLYLVLTGLGAVVVVAIPGLVVFGLMLCILPGLVLGVLPTAFLWGSCFAAFWFPLHHRLGDAGASLVAAVATLVLLVLLTVPGNLYAVARLRSLELPDVMPDTPLVLTGDVRLDLLRGATLDQDPSARDGHVRPYRCDALCLAVLALPGVTSVTVNGLEPDGTLKASARTFRLVPPDQVRGRRVVPPLLSHRADALGTSPAERSRREAELLARLATDERLVMEPALDRYDLRVREAWDGRFAARDARWSPLATSTVRSLTVEDALGAPRLRFHRVAISAPAPPRWSCPR